MHADVNAFTCDNMHVLMRSSIVSRDTVGASLALIIIAKPHFVKLTKISRKGKKKKKPRATCSFSFFAFFARLGFGVSLCPVDR